MIVDIFSDGGSRGNPGKAAWGIVIKNSQTQDTIDQLSGYIGLATNNQAEYFGAINSLEWVEKNFHNYEKFTIKFDSQLIARQIKGEYKVKDQNIQHLAHKSIALFKKLSNKLSIVEIPRSENSSADKLVNLTLDNN